MPGIRLVITVEQATLTLQQQFNAHVDRAKTCQALLNLFTGIDAGNWRAGRVEIQQGQGMVNGVAASQTVTYVTPSGAQTVTIGGVAVAFTAGADAAATVQAAIAAIRAHPVASGLVFIPQLPTYVFNNANVLKLWANTIPVANTLGNGLTLAATGTGATANGATFTGGVNATLNGFSV